MENKIVLTKLKGEDGYKTSSIRLPKNLFCKLDEVAGEVGISRNQLIIKLLSNAIDCVEIKEKE